MADETRQPQPKPPLGPLNRGIRDRLRRLSVGHVLTVYDLAALHDLLDMEALAQANEPRAIMRAHDWDEDDLMSGFFVLANHELARARAKHGPMHSHHEAWGVIQEELDEVWDEVKRQTPDPQRIISELVQVAAMCARWAEDVCGEGEP